MKQIEATRTLDSWDKKGRSVFRKRDLSLIFGENGKTLDQTLARLMESGILQRVAHGIYLYSFSKHVGPMTIEHIARNLRRGELTFESLESALSQYGVISQIPLDRITLMTTGRSGEYRTPYGTIEFTHTKADAGTIRANIIDREDHPLPIANKQYAYANLRAVGRNLALVDEEELHAKD